MRLDIVGPGRLGRSLFALLSTHHDVRLLGRGDPVEGPTVMLAVPDAAIPEAARTVPHGCTVLHCSGTTPFEILRPHHPAGSFHPLMTFPGPERGIPELHDVPVALSGDEHAVVIGRELAATLEMMAIDVPGDRRLYHAAAVMAGNFATVLLADASRALVAAGISPEDAPALLAPLALESLRSAVRVGPAQALTGPVARGDEPTLDGHRDALQAAGLSDLISVYDALTSRARALADEKAVVAADPGAKV